MEAIREPIKQMIFRVPESVQRRFKSIAALSGKTMTEILIDWVKAAAQGQGEPKTREELLEIARRPTRFPLRTFSKKEKAQFLKDDQA